MKELTTEIKESIRLALGEYCDNYASRNRASESLNGVSSATVSQILNGKYEKVSDDMFVRIDIADHGTGIPEDELCNIWKRFYRGKNAEKENGVGIGLYLTANILNTEGGRVSAKSDENGSTFTVYLPKS